jgi:hypothetical protein
MANELKHGSVGTELTQSEFEGVGLHVFDSQATGDMVYASSGSQLSRLAKGADNTVLQMGGSNIPEWVSDIALNSSSVNEPLLTITNTHADQTGGYVKFVKDPASGQGADNDVMGTITWHGTDASNNAAEELARIEGYVVEADHGSEAGGIKFYVAENDATMTSGLEIIGQAAADGEIDVNIGAGAASTTTIKGTLTMGSTAALTNAGLVAVANQSNITGLGTITSGTWQGTVVAAAYLPDASTSAQGVSELATSTEVSTGTDTGRTITPDALAESVIFGTRYVQCVVFDFATDIAEGNGKFYFHVPAGLNGMDLVEVHSEVITAGNGSTVDVQIHNATDSSDMLSTSLTIDSTETGSDTAATAAVINGSEDDVATNDLIRIDVDGNGGDTTIAKGLIVTLGFRLP